MTTTTAATTSQADKPKVLPTYLVLDTSSSMAPFEDLLNATFVNLYDTLYEHPVVAEFIHLASLSFNTTATVIVPMTDIENLQTLPKVRCDGRTKLSPMFQLLNNTIETDVQRLVSSGHGVYRPVVFLLTDGLPTDTPVGSWEVDLGILRDTSNRLRPNIIAYGFGDASEDVLKKVATHGLFLAEQGVKNVEALTSAMSSLLNSLLASGQTRQMQVPEKVEGFRSVPLDFIG